MVCAVAVAVSLQAVSQVKFQISKEKFTSSDFRMICNIKIELVCLICIGVMSICIFVMIDQNMRYRSNIGLLIIY